MNRDVISILKIEFKNDHFYDFLRSILGFYVISETSPLNIQNILVVSMSILNFFFSNKKTLTIEKLNIYSNTKINIF